MQSTGDGIFALFGAPVAHEDHPQRALYRRAPHAGRRQALRREAARGEGSQSLQVRVGVNTGEVVVRSIKTDDGAYRVHADRAFDQPRVANAGARSRPGSIAISEQTRKLVRGLLRAQAAGPDRVKGVSEPVNVYEVTGLGPLRTRLQRSAGRGLYEVCRARARDGRDEATRPSRPRPGTGRSSPRWPRPGVGKSRLFLRVQGQVPIRLDGAGERSRSRMARHLHICR